AASATLADATSAIISLETIADRASVRFFITNTLPSRVPAWSQTRSGATFAHLCSATCPTPGPGAPEVEAEHGRAGQDREDPRFCPLDGTDRDQLARSLIARPSSTQRHPNAWRPGRYNRVTDVPAAT